jgi:hypothetical protein
MKKLILSGFAVIGLPAMAAITGYHGNVNSGFDVENCGQRLQGITGVSEVKIDLPSRSIALELTMPRALSQICNLDCLDGVSQDESGIPMCPPRRHSAPQD